jgi:cbb3-type cytochrome oxidase maturation protein
VNILLVLIPVSLAFVGISLWAFFWATNSGQFDDLETPALRMLSDEDERPHRDEATTSAQAARRPDDAP